MSFTVQYTALILIILSFLIGAFIRPEGTEIASKEKNKEVVVLDNAPKEKKKIKLTKLEFNKVFLEGSDKLLPEELVGLTQLLLSHDLKAELTIYGSSTKLILSRIAKLQDYLLEAGLPLSAYDVKAIKEKNLKQLSVKVIYI